MIRPRVPATIAVLPLCLAAGGCFPWALFDDDDAVDPPPVATQPAVLPPSIDVITVPDWPPIGPNATVVAEVRDDAGLATVSFDFRDTVSRIVSGTRASVEVRGSELGEGLGRLTVLATDVDGATAERSVTDLLVDLSPPEVTITRRVLKASGAHFDAWVADAWVLGDIELSFGGMTFSESFEEGYPSSLGDEWQYALFRIDSESLPMGKGIATLTVHDAADNLASESFELTIDGQPPTVQLTDPPAGSSVSGTFWVSLEASDAEGPTTVELRLGGAPVASATGPNATIELDAADFAAGQLTLEAVAIDEAGNESTPAEVSLMVQ
jgi:hypothetical protein